MTAHTVIDTADRAAHSEWGGSVATRVLNCYGSVALNRSVPRRPAGYAAEEGTWMHALAGYALEQGLRTVSMFAHQSLPAGVEVPAQFSGHVFGKDRVAAVQAYLDVVYEELALSKDAVLLVEYDVEFGIDGVFGRCDAVIWHPSLLRLRCIDAKFGEGMEVEVEDNDQAQFYTASLLRMRPEWKPKQLVMTIVQPRHYTVLNGTRPAAVDCEVFPPDLELWALDYEEAIEQSRVCCDNPALVEANLTAGPWCDKTFCDAMAVCPAQHGRALVAVQNGFAGVQIDDLSDVTAVELLPPSELDIARLERLAAAAKMLAKYAEKCEEYLYGLAMNGHALELFKVVDKVGRRKYVVDDFEVADYLEVTFGIPQDVALRTELQTMTEMKKILKQYGATADDLADFELRFTSKESSGTTLAPISDKRTAVPLLANAFAGVNIPTA